MPIKMQKQNGKIILIEKQITENNSCDVNMIKESSSTTLIVY